MFSKTRSARTALVCRERDGGIDTTTYRKGVETPSRVKLRVQSGKETGDDHSDIGDDEEYGVRCREAGEEGEVEEEEWGLRRRGRTDVIRLWAHVEK